MRDQKSTTEEVYVRATKKQFHQLWIHTNADPLPRANTEWQKEENNRDPIVLRAHTQNAARPTEQYISTPKRIHHPSPMTNNPQSIITTHARDVRSTFTLLLKRTAAEVEEHHTAAGVEERHTAAEAAGTVAAAGARSQPAAARASCSAWPSCGA